MAASNYRALRIVLIVLTVLMGIGGLLMILGSRSLILTVFMHPPESEMSTLMLATLKELGGTAVMLGVLLLFATRDPVRNVAIIDGLIIGLVVLAATAVLSLATLDLQRLYSAKLIWTRSLVRLALAIALYWLRPRDSRGVYDHTAL
jgi:uncharacterized membrane protein (Fun14 family)